MSDLSELLEAAPARPVFSDSNTAQDFLRPMNPTVGLSTPSLFGLAMLAKSFRKSNPSARLADFVDYVADAP